MPEIYKMFHGTTDVFLGSILDNGLVPTPPKKSWSDHKAASIDIPSRKALAGVYFSSDLHTAGNASWRATEKFGGDEIIIVADINPHTAIADEDQIWCHIEEVLYKNIIKRDCQWRYPSKFLGILDGMEYYNRKHLEKCFCDDLNKEISLGYPHPIDYDLLTNVFYASLHRILAHSFVESPLFYATKYYSGGNVKKPPHPMTIEEAEENYLDVVDILTRTYTYSVYRRPNKNHTLRILDSVKLNGVNKITGIHEINVIDGLVKPIYSKNLIPVAQFHMSECSQSL